MAHFFSRPFSAELKQDWNKVLKQAGKPHFFFTREFVEEEDDASVLVYKNKMPVALFPAKFLAEKKVSSHPNMSFGGLIFTPLLHLYELPQALLSVFSYYLSRGISEMVYKATPSVYFPQAEGLLPWLFRCTSSLPKVELNALLPLVAPLNQDSAHKMRLAQKAKQEHIFFVKNDSPSFVWQILEEQLWKKHKKKPTHNATEFLTLMRTFPKNVQLWEAHHPIHKLCAGAATFQNSRVIHTQYLTSSTEGQKLGALNLLVQHLRQCAQHKGLHFLSLGVSEEREKSALNFGLLRWKSEFGAFGSPHYIFHLSLPEVYPKLAAVLAL